MAPTSSIQWFTVANAQISITVPGKSGRPSQQKLVDVWEWITRLCAKKRSKAIRALYRRSGSGGGSGGSDDGDTAHYVKLGTDAILGDGDRLQCADLVVNNGRFHVNMPIALAVPWLRLRAQFLPSTTTTNDAAATTTTDSKWCVSPDHDPGIEIVHNGGGDGPLLDAHPAANLPIPIAGVIMAREWEHYQRARVYYPRRELRLVAGVHDHELRALAHLVADRDTRAQACFGACLPSASLPEMWPCDLHADTPHRDAAACYHEVLKRDALATYHVPYRPALVARAHRQQQQQSGNSHSSRRDLLRTRLATDQQLDWLIECGAIVARGADRDALFLPPMNYAEQSFVAALCEMHARQPHISADNRIKFTTDNGPATCTLNVRQRLAVATFRYRCPYQIMVLGGRGGTGKTHVLKHMLHGITTLFCAPTGQAAGVLARACARNDCIAETLHRTIACLSREDSADDPNLFYRHVQALVIDEASMASCELAARALQLLLDVGAPLQRLIVVGDRDQLPAVDTGGLLDDLLRAPRRIVPYVELQRNMRSNSQLVYHNSYCLKVNRPHFMRFDAKTFHFVPRPASDDALIKWFVDNVFKRYTPNDLHWHIISARNATINRINDRYADYCAARVHNALPRHDAAIAVPFEQQDRLSPLLYKPG